MWSPLLECPCTDRKPKVITQHNTRESGFCPTTINTSRDCFTAVAALGLLPALINTTLADRTMPAGCSVRASAQVAHSHEHNATCSYHSVSLHLNLTITLSKRNPNPEP